MLKVLNGTMNANKELKSVRALHVCCMDNVNGFWSELCWSVCRISASGARHSSTALTDKPSSCAWWAGLKRAASPSQDPLARTTWRWGMKANRLCSKAFWESLSVHRAAIRTSGIKEPDWGSRRRPIRSLRSILMQGTQCDSMTESYRIVHSKVNARSSFTHPHIVYKPHQSSSKKGKTTNSPYEICLEWCKGE